MINLTTGGISLSFDPALGLIEGFRVQDGGTDIAPLHRAPWVRLNEVMPEGIAPHLVKLGGDFFCAPFGSTEGASPLHGWPPNSPWSLREQTQTYLRAELDRSVFGARLTKEITLRPGHPFVYQRHSFSGGQGQVPVANHANVALPNGGLIRTSDKSCWRTPPTPQEEDPARGRSYLIYPAESNGLTSFPTQDGLEDLSHYPWFPNGEDFVVGIEAPGHRLAWTAITRPAEGDVFLSLKSAQDVPMTMLWHSNGGRDFPPWSGRHFGCLGVEEGAAMSVLGVDPITDPSRRDAIRLDPEGTVEITHVIGAIRWPSGSAVDCVEVEENHLLMRGVDGEVREVPFDPEALDLP